MFFNRWINKMSVVHSYNGILFNNKQKGRNYESAKKTWV